MPLSHLSSQEAQRLVDRAAPYYSGAVFHGAILLGYFFLSLECFLRLGPAAESNFMPEALVLVTLGTVAQARGLIKLLAIEGPNSTKDASPIFTTPASPQLLRE